MLRWRPGDALARERIRQLQNVALTKMRRALRRKERPLPKPFEGDAVTP